MTGHYVVHGRSNDGLGAGITSRLLVAMPLQHLLHSGALFTTVLLVEYVDSKLLGP
jgi:hypothetical protein